LRRGSLDRRLAAGANPDECDDLRRRADQLRSSVHRRELAAVLLGLVEQAEGPAHLVSAAVPIDRRSIRAARSDVIGLALDLGAADLDASARGIALVERLLFDGASPAYAPLGPATLTQALREAHAALLCVCGGQHQLKEEPQRWKPVPGKFPKSRSAERPSS
jgi:hypothetical protein